MLSIEIIDETVSKYYDDEMNESELLGYEARIANSNYAKDYTYQKCFEFYKISSSIKKTMRQNEKYSSLLCDEILNKNKDKLFFNFNSVIYKCLNKILRRLTLDSLRHNSKKFYGF